MRLLAYLRLEREDQEEADKAHRRRVDPKYDRLVAEAEGQAPKTADEVLRRRLASLKKEGG